MRFAIGFSLAAGAALGLAPASAQPAGDAAGQVQPEVVRPLTPIPAERLEQMVPKHPGYLGALAPENLQRSRPAAPFDGRHRRTATGTHTIRRWRARRLSPLHTSNTRLTVIGT